MKASGNGLKQYRQALPLGPVYVKSNQLHGKYGGKNETLQRNPFVSPQYANRKVIPTDSVDNTNDDVRSFCPCVSYLQPLHMCR